MLRNAAAALTKLVGLDLLLMYFDTRLGGYTFKEALITQQSSSAVLVEIWFSMLTWNPLLLFV